MWMKDTKIPLDQIAINGDDEVVLVYKAQPEDETLVPFMNAKYILEVNQDSGIVEGDFLSEVYELYSSIVGGMKFAPSEFWSMTLKEAKLVVKGDRERQEKIYAQEMEKYKNDNSERNKENKL